MLGLVERLRVEGKCALGDEGGEEDDTAAHAELDASNFTQGLDNVAVGNEVAVDDLAKNRREYSVENDAVVAIRDVSKECGCNSEEKKDALGREEEGHDGAKRADAHVGEVHLAERALDVSSERDVSGGPSVRDRQEARSGDPRPSDVPLSDAIRKDGHNPDDVERKGVESEPWQRGWHTVGQEEDSEGTEEFAEVGASNDDLRPCRGAEDSSGVSGRKGRLEESVQIEGERVRDGKPDKLARSENDLATDPDGLAEAEESVTDRDEVVAVLSLDGRESSIALGLLR